MRMIIEARIEDSTGASEPIRLAEFERVDGELKQLGLSLAEGWSLTYEAQRALVNVQAQVFVAASKSTSPSILTHPSSFSGKFRLRVNKATQPVFLREGGLKPF